MRFIGNPEHVAAVGDRTLYRVTASSPARPEPRAMPLMRGPATAAVLPFDREHAYFVLTRQDRVGALGAPVLEAPGGRVNPGEDYEQAARRELREELGLAAAEWRVVAAETYASPGHSNQQMWLYLASGLTKVRGGEIESEIEPVRLPLAELDAQLDHFRRPSAPGEPRKDHKTLTLLQALRLELLAD